ncbi:MAG TPA: sugar phosphate isomerase/epimerase family protein [Thermomicrobiales bacterium]|nr:sugar phosphate isomerase/epimerase family protein [Thermomicrobiales bacterium]
MPVKLAISSYSFHRFGGGPEGDDARTIEQMTDGCADYGVSGLEVLMQHFERNDATSPNRLHELRQYAAIRGITPVTVAANNNPVQPDPGQREVELQKVRDAVDMAQAIGAPFVRAMGGRWHTTSSFQEMLEHGGEEPPAEGYTEDDGYDWAISALKEGAAYAGERGVTLVLENHWGLTGTAGGCVRIHDAVDSPWLKYVLDLGNFFRRPDQYAEMARFFGDLAVVHAKVYLGGGMLVEPEIDYERVAGMLEEIGYSGYISMEFEGKAHPDDGIPAGLEQLRSAFGLPPGA